MDATEVARSLLDPVPAHRTAGLEVRNARDGVGVVAVQVRQEISNVIGSLHSSGLITLIDAAGLAAIVSACPDASMAKGVLPLGSAASLRFLAPARGRLVATCALDDTTRDQLNALFSGVEERVRISTVAEVTDESGKVVCRGTFDWTVRRTAPSPGPR